MTNIQCLHDELQGLGLLSLKEVSAFHESGKGFWPDKDAFLKKHLLRLAWTFIVVLVLFIWLFTYGRIRLEKEMVFDAAISDSQNTAAIVALNLQQILNRAELYAKISVTYLENGRMPTSVLIPGLTGDSTYLRLAIFDLSGELRFSSSSRRREPEMEPVIRDLLAMKPEHRPNMVVGKAGEGASAWRMPIGLPIYSGKGQPVGFFAAIVDLGYFLKLYSEIDMGETGSLGAFDDRGTLLAELTRMGLNAGPQFASAVYGRFIASPANSGAIHPMMVDKNLSSIGAFRAAGDYPFVITVIRNAKSVLGTFYQRRSDYLIQALIASVMVVIMLSGLVSLIRRQQGLLETLTESEVEKEKLIEALENEKTRAYQLASYDYLTGIPNRMLFHELAQAELSRAKRSRNTYAILFLDLNKFKLVNDTLGHSVGDLLLKSVAQRLRQSIRAYDIVSRLGGDEFVILLSEMRSEQQIADIARKVIRTINEPYKDLEGHDIEISTSIGIAVFPRDGATIDTLLLHADAAMYRAKSKGAGKYSFYDASLSYTTDRHIELLGRFRFAMQHDEFCLHFQPKIDLDRMQICGLEALIRWNHPQHGLLAPGEFISLAEHNDLIVPLGEWIINAAVMQIASWRSRGVDVPPVAINISAKQLRDEAILDTFSRALRKHAVPPHLIEIEITESCLIEDVDLTRSLLERLRASGIRMAIDDYGTGFSGLSSLKQLPVYAVKIDKSFVKDLRNDVNDAAIVGYTISLAHNLGLLVVAEGVETKEQAVYLKAAGCDQVQGYYFQRPLPAQDIPLLLKNGVTGLDKVVPAMKDDVPSHEIV